MSPPPGIRSEDAAAPLGYGRPFVDQDDVDAVVEVLRSGLLTQGTTVGRFEAGLVRATGAGQAVAVSSGTAALQLAFLGLGIGPGTRVLLPANTFLATATAALWCGAEVEFLDVEPRTGNLDVDLLEGRLQAGDPPDLVTAVHFAGLPCDMERLIALRRTHGFRLVEDAAHALGARYRVDGRWWRPGERAEVDAACLSFHPLKHITTGEGGAVLTHDRELATRLRRLREHGLDFAEVGRAGGAPSPGFAPMVELGLNARLSEVHAALGTSQLRKLPDFLAARREIAMRYVAELRDYELLDPGGGDREHAWHLFCVRVAEGERNELMQALRERGIQTQVHYHPVPSHPWFADNHDGVALPNAERHGRTTLSLPIFPALTEGEQARVVEALQAWRRHRSVA